jgi:hypothetical protein
LELTVTTGDTMLKKTVNKARSIVKKTRARLKKAEAHAKKVAKKYHASKH